MQLEVKTATSAETGHAAIGDVAKLKEQTLWGRLFAVVALIWGGGALLGPLIGGVFAHLGAWRLAFL